MWCFFSLGGSSEFEIQKAVNTHMYRFVIISGYLWESTEQIVNITNRAYAIHLLNMRDDRVTTFPTMQQQR